MSDTIRELELKISFTEEGIKQMGVAWEDGEYEGDYDHYRRDIKNSEQFLERYQKRIDAIKKKENR